MDSWWMDHGEWNGTPDVVHVLDRFGAPSRRTCQTWCRPVQECYIKSNQLWKRHDHIGPPSVCWLVTARVNVAIADSSGVPCVHCHDVWIHHAGACQQRPDMAWSRWHVGMNQLWGLYSTAWYCYVLFNCTSRNSYRTCSTFYLNIQTTNRYKSIIYQSSKSP